MASYKREKKNTRPKLFFQWPPLPCRITASTPQTDDTTSSMVTITKSVTAADFRLLVDLRAGRQGAA